MTEYWANNCEAYLADLSFNPKKKDSYPKSMEKIWAITQTPSICQVWNTINMKVKIMLCYSIWRIVIIMLSWCPQQNWQELLSNLPTTLKDYHKPDTNKNFKQQKHKQRLQFNNNNENLYQLQKNLHKYKQPIDILQKSEIERQVAYEIGETNCEEEQQQWRIQMLMMHGFKLHYRMGCLIILI